MNIHSYILVNSDVKLFLILLWTPQETPSNDPWRFPVLERCCREADTYKTFLPAADSPALLEEANFCFFKKKNNNNIAVQWGKQFKTIQFSLINMRNIVCTSPLRYK